MPPVVYNWADLQSGHGLRYYGNITRTRNVSEHMLVLALCLAEFVSNFISSPSDGKNRKKLNNYTIQHNEMKSIDRLSYTYSLNSIYQITSISTVKQIEQASSHKIYKDNRESLNKRLLQESYFTRNILDLSAIMALGNLKPNISWHSVTVWISLVLNNFTKNRLTEKSSDPRLVLI